MTIPLTDEEIAVIDGYTRTIAEATSQRQGALNMSIATRKLKGNWEYRNGTLVQDVSEAIPSGEPKRYHIMGASFLIHDTPGSQAADSIARELDADCYGIRDLQLAPGDTVVDIGAHVGMFSILMGMMHPDIRILAYEPHPDNFALLTKNISLNGVKNVFVDQRAVTSDGRRISLTGNTINSGGVSALVQGDGPRVEAESVSLDQLFQRHAVKRCALLKIDCEGMEYEILYAPSAPLNKIARLSGEFHSLVGKDANGMVPANLLAFCQKNIPRVKAHFCPMGMVGSSAPVLNEVDALAVAALDARDKEHDINRAEKLAREAVALGPAQSAAHLLLASCLGFKERNDESLVVLEEALQRFPSETDTILNERAFHNLRMQRWHEGWEDWEHRVQVGALRERIAGCLPGVPEWDGCDLDGGTLLVNSEGGIGDAMMYLRWLPALAARGIKILLCCKETVLADFFRELPYVWDAFGGDSSHTVKPAAFVQLWSLPWKLEMYDPPSLPQVPVYWKPRTFQTKLRVGVHWKGTGNGPAHHWRPSNLDSWKPILSLKNVEFVSLQLGETPKGMTEALDNDASLIDTMRVIADLDLVICGDGIISHLAGSMGAPTWLLLHRYGFWPWESDAGKKGATLWYPSVRVFQMMESEKWGQVFQIVSKEFQVIQNTGGCFIPRREIDLLHCVAEAAALGAVNG